MDIARIRAEVALAAAERYAQRAILAMERGCYSAAQDLVAAAQSAHIRARMALEDMEHGTRGKQSGGRDERGRSNACSARWPDRGVDDGAGEGDTLDD